MPSPLTRLEFSPEELVLFRRLLRRRLGALGPAGALDETGLDEIELLTHLLQRTAALDATPDPSLYLSPLELPVAARCVVSHPGGPGPGPESAAASARLRLQIRRLMAAPQGGGRWRQLLTWLIPLAVMG